MPSLALRGGRLWDGSAEASREAVVVTGGGAIAATDGATGATETIDISGCTVIPGLIEGHGHLCFNAGADWRAVYDSDSPSRMVLRMALHGRRMLEAGITTVRDLGAPTALSIEVRDAFRDGLVPGPDLLVAGAPITTTGGHCHFMGGEADGEAEVRKAVRGLVKAGVDWVKVMATGGNMTRGTNTLAAQFTADELRACVEEAHRLRRRVAAHCHGTAGIRVAVQAGVDTIEHCSFTGPGGIDYDPEVVKAIAAKGIIVSPTVSVGYRRWTDDGLRQRRAYVMREILAAGCPLLMSTDCGIPNVPHEALGEGLEVMSELCALTPVAALRLATSGAAELLGLSGRGVIAPANRADLLVVEGDPTQNLAALQRVRLVLKAGEVVFRA